MFDDAKVGKVTAFVLDSLRGRLKIGKLTLVHGCGGTSTCVLQIKENSGLTVRNAEERVSVSTHGLSPPSSRRS